MHARKVGKAGKVGKTRKHIFLNNDIVFSGDTRP